MKIVGMILARMKSGRFPGKVIAELYGKPMICWLIELCHKVGIVPVVATSSDPSNDELAKISENAGAMVYRGSELDLLSRITEAIEYVGCDVTLDLGADSPFRDVAIVREGIRFVAGHPEFWRYNPRPHLNASVGFPIATFIRTEWYAAYKQLYASIHPRFQEKWQEQFWCLHTDPEAPVEADRLERLVNDEKSITFESDLLNYTQTPFKASVDYPLELAVFNKVIEYIGHWPWSLRELQDAYEGMTEL